jgi:hypothetical protein
MIDSPDPELGSENKTSVVSWKHFTKKQMPVFLHMVGPDLNDVKVKPEGQYFLYPLRILILFIFVWLDPIVFVGVGIGIDLSGSMFSIPISTPMFVGFC